MLARGVFRRGYGVAIVGILMIGRGLGQRRGMGLRLRGKRFVGGVGVLFIIVFMIMFVMIMFVVIVVAVTVASCR